MATDTRPTAGPPRDLGPRMLWGLVMAAVALALTWSGLLPFAGLVLAVALVVSWEWGRIVRRSEGDLILAIHGLAVVAAVALAVAGLTALALVVLAIGTILAALLGFDRLGRLSALGVLYAGLPAVALVWLRASRPLGLEAILFLFAVVWATDTGAYAAGRMFGGPRLIPSLSPNKTWSGLAGGVLASLVVALAFAAVVPGARSLWLAPLAIGLAIVSQGGDLMESALKRWHGVKDASGLIPGHGGVMDRVDGLIFAAVALALLGAALDVMAPARVLLTGVR